MIRSLEIISIRIILFKNKEWFYEKEIGYYIKIKVNNFFFSLLIMCAILSCRYHLLQVKILLNLGSKQVYDSVFIDYQYTDFFFKVNSGFMNIINKTK